MKKDLIVRLEGIIFSSSDLLTLAEKDFLKKRDYSSRIINALDNYLNIKQSDSTEEMISSAKQKFSELVDEYENENENCYTEKSLSRIQAFREIDGSLYTVGDVLKNEFYYKENEDEYKKAIERIKIRISRNLIKLQKYKNNPNNKEYVKCLKALIESDKTILKYYKKKVLKQVETD